MRKGIVRVGVVLAGLLLLIAGLVYMSAAPALAGSRAAGSEGSQALAATGGNDRQMRPNTRTPTRTRTATRTPTRTFTPMNTPTNTPTNTPVPACGLAWREVAPARPATAFYGIEVISANDIWAVGIEYSANPAKMLIEHWDGTQWSIVPAPNVGADVAYLFAVSAVSANDIWAIGTRNSRTLAIHWNGTQWSIVDTPNPGGHENYITDVTAVSANDVWAVGYHRSAPTYASVPLAIHWDGTSWNIVPSPNPGTFSTALASVDAISANDIWAVGSTTVTSGGHAQTLAMHWDGSSWNVVPTGILQQTLSSVSAVSSNDVWAVGNHRAGLYVITMHWNGSNWSVVPQPEPANDQIYLNDVDAIASNDAWAVGYYTSLEVGGDVPLLIHWDGAQWTEFERDWGVAPDYLTAVAAVSGKDVWTTGYNYTDGVFFLHYSEPCELAGVKR